MSDIFTDDTQLNIDDGFMDSSSMPEEPPENNDIVVLPNNDESLATPTPVMVTATPTPIMVTATPTPFPEVTTLPPEQGADVTIIPGGSETPLGDSSNTDTAETGNPETGHTIDDIYNLLTERVKALEEQEKAKKEEKEKEPEASIEYRTYMTEQSRNVLSVSSLIFITLAFLTGILLARIVWRKL